MYPLVPGHEIIGVVQSVGNHVGKFKAGDTVGVGCLVDSCRTCNNCQEGLEQYCLNGMVLTYSNYEKDGKTITYGGYSKQIVVKEEFVVRVPDTLPLEKVAPLLCAGITTYSPLRNWNIGKGHKVGVVGLGGLGHMAVKFTSAFGAEVTVLSTSPSKKRMPSGWEHKNSFPPGMRSKYSNWQATLFLSSIGLLRLMTTIFI